MARRECVIKLLKSTHCILIFFSYTIQSFAKSESCELILSTTRASSQIFSTMTNFDSVRKSTKVFEIAQDHKVAYRYTPAQEGKPTLVLLNGVIYSLDSWNDYYEGLVEQGYGVLLIAYSTQPESLSFLEEGVEPHFGRIGGIDISKPIRSVFDYKLNRLSSQNLVDEVMALINHLKILRFDLVSLSYSSFIALNVAMQEKDRINSFILQAPAIMPSNRYNPYGEARHKYYEWLRMNPLSNADYLADYLADYELYLTMYGALFTQYINLPNHLTDFDKFFNGVYQMVRSVKWRDLKDYTKADFPKMHLFLASKEEFTLLDDQLRFWKMMTGNKAKGSLVLFLEALHDIPTSGTKSSIDMTVKAVEGGLNDEYVEVVSKQ